MYALAHALHNMLLSRCGSVRICAAVQPVPTGRELLQHIRNVSFIGEWHTAAVAARPDLSTAAPGHIDRPLPPRPGREGMSR